MQKFEIEIKDLIENFYNSEYENLDEIIIKCEKTKEMENNENKRLSIYNKIMYKQGFID